MVDRIGSYVDVLIHSPEIPHEGPMADLVWSDPDPDKEDFAISPRSVHILSGFNICPPTPTSRGAGYTFGAGIVKKFLQINNMSHILRAHQLCMEGFSILYDNHLSTVWSAPNYCYRCGNLASILEVGPGEGSMHFNVFEAAPENERDGPSHQAAQNAGGKVSFCYLTLISNMLNDLLTARSLAPRILPIV